MEKNWEDNRQSFSKSIEVRLFILWRSFNKKSSLIEFARKTVTSERKVESYLSRSQEKKVKYWSDEPE